jgi:regulator of sirC expression with transglutaminase-like and TPR domain
VILSVLKAQQTFRDIAALDESVFPLDRAALAIGLEEYPDLNLDEYLKKIDTLASRVEMMVGEDRTPSALLEALKEVMFVQEALKPNQEDYYDPRNSFINDVLDRKVGIPISLSVIFIEVARRINFPVYGVGFPGHFLVKVHENEKELLIDVFNRGKIINVKDCQDLLDQIYGGSVAIQQSFLQSMSKKSIISRMLFNLKAIYYQREDYYRALTMVDRILMLNPGTPSEIRDRGLLFMQTSLFAQALADLNYYLETVPSPDDASYIEGHIQTLRKIIAAGN